MADTAPVTLVVELKMHAGKTDEYRQECAEVTELLATEPGALGHAYSFAGDVAMVREDYADADGLLAHLEHAAKFTEHTLNITDIERFEIHGPEAELDKLRPVLGEFEPSFYTTEFSSRR